MAYSGLGAGTVGDPYQITTVAQFMEMNDAAYAGIYFLLMNNLDFSSEVSISLPNFYCKFWGGGFTLNNIQLYTGGFITLRTGCVFINANLIFDRFTSDSLSIFNGTTNATVDIYTLSVVCRNTDGYSAKLFNESLNLYTSSSIHDIKAEGNYIRLLPKMWCGAYNIKIYNSCAQHVSLIYRVVGSFTFSNAIYFKPFTYIAVVAYKGLFIDDTQSYVITISNSAVVVNKFIDEGGSGVRIGGFVGNGQMNITDSYVIGYFSSLRATYIHALYGGSSNSSCVFTNNYFYGDIIAPLKSELSVVTALASTGCKYCKALLTNQSFNDTYATDLTVAQFQSSSNFSGWDFSNFWVQGADRPTLINASESLDVFEAGSLLDIGNITIGTVTKLSNTQFQVPITTDNTKNYGFDIVENGVVWGSRVNQNGNVVIDTTSDIEATIKAYHLIQTTKFYTDSKTYYHFHLDQIAVTDIIVDKYVLLQNGLNKGAYIHGSVLVGNYLYGTSRGAPASVSPNHSLVKALASDVAQFTLFPILVTAAGLGEGEMDSVVKLGDRLFSVAKNGTNIYMIVWNLLIDDYQSYLIGTGTVYGAPSCNDENYIYVYMAGFLHKINPAVFNSVNKFNTDTVWDTQAVKLAYVATYGHPHTMCVDDSYLYVGIGTGGSSSAEKSLQKIDKATMTLLGSVGVPKMTDDMCQTATHLFLGIEQGNSTAVGYNVGCIAIRKSDLRVTKIRKLHTSDTASVTSYASLIFGNYLIDSKTNSHIYALDISGVDEWNNDDIGAHTLKAYRMLKPDGSAITLPINEVLLPESGVFVGFGWASTSYVAKFNLTGLNYFSIPAVTTDDSAIIEIVNASLSGTIVTTGGRTVTACGIILGNESDLSDGIKFPMAEVTTDILLSFNNLGYGVYYWQAYATNAEGDGVGDIKSFEIAFPYTDPGQPTDIANTITINVLLSWVAPLDNGGANIVGYKIERKPVDGAWAVIVANTGNANLTYTDPVEVGNYKYRISTITSYATGLPSVEFAVSATTGSGNYRIFLGSTEIVAM